MSDLPEPPIPADVDLQDFAFMPLHVARLRDSDLAATEDPETCWYAVLLWAASWHQIPAGSLPDNDAALMRLVGLGRDARTWRKHRAGALRGFTLCSDGRLYHAVVVENAKEAWSQKISQRHRSFCGAVRKHNERNPENRLQSPSFEQWEAMGRPERVAHLVTQMSRVTSENVTCDIGSKGQGQGQGQVYSNNNPPTPQDDRDGISDPPQGQQEGKSPERNYAFAGRTVRLNQADLDQWAVTFSGIPDLVAELTAIDAWWQGQDDPRPKNWFLRTSQMLNRKHQAAIADRAKAMDPTAPLDPAGSFLDHQIQKRRQREVWQAEREAAGD